MEIVHFSTQRFLQKKVSEQVSDMLSLLYRTKEHNSNKFHFQYVHYGALRKKYK
jgi:hypothetical protein